jgi:transglutaminase-like putative cysteine protease
MTARPGFTELAADVVTASTLAAGLGSMALVLRGYEPDPILPLGICLLISAVLALATRRRYGLPVLAAVVVLAALIPPMLNGDWAGWVDTLAQGRQEALFLLLRGRIEDVWLLRLEPILLLVPTALSLVFVRRWGSLPFAALWTLGTSVPLLVWYPKALSPVLLLVAGCALLLPRDFLRRVHRRNSKSPSLRRGPLQIFAIPVVLLCLVFADSLIPADTLGWRSPLLLNQIGDWQLEGMGRLGAIRAWEAFGLDSFGFMPSGQRLGGPVSLSDRKFLDVRTDTPGLLRGSTRSVYTGSSWETGPMRQYRFGALRWSRVQSNLFGTDLPTGEEGRTFLTQFGRTVRATVTIEANLDSTFFVSGRLRDLRGTDPFNPAYFSSETDVFVFSPMRRLASYQTESLVFDSGIPGFAEAVASVADGATTREESRFQEASRTFLQLPEGLPSRVAETARDAVGDETEPYRQALKLVEYLRTGFTYTLTPDVPPADRDFVDRFLEDREGYCVYYASALAVMARTLGIPSRYVEGFALTPDTEPGRYLATGKTAHAWTELYFKGIGWLTFDATPSVGDGGAITPTPPAPTPGGPDPSATPSPSPTAGPPVPPIPTSDPGRWVLVLLAILLPVGAFFAFVSLRRALHRRSFDAAAVSRRLPGPSERLEYYYKDVLAQLALLDLRPQPGETLSSFAERAERSLLIGPHPMPEVLAPVQALRYGGIAPDPEALQRLADYRASLEERLRNSLSTSRYLWGRILFGGRRFG